MAMFTPAGNSVFIESSKHRPIGRSRGSTVAECCGLVYHKREPFLYIKLIQSAVVCRLTLTGWRIIWKKPNAVASCIEPPRLALYCVDRLRASKSQIDGSWNTWKMRFMDTNRMSGAARLARNNNGRELTLLFHVRAFRSLSSRGLLLHYSVQSFNNF